MKPVSTTSVASDDLIYCLWLGRKKKRETITWLTEEKQTRIKRGCCFCFCSFCCCCLWGNWARWSMPAPVAKSADGHQFFFWGGGESNYELSPSFFLFLSRISLRGVVFFFFLFVPSYVFGGRGGGKSFSILIWSCCFFFRQRLNPLRRFLTFKLSVFSFDFSELETRKMSRLFSAHGSAFFLRRNCQKKKQTKPNDFGGRGWAWRG